MLIAYISIIYLKYSKWKLKIDKRLKLRYSFMKVVNNTKKINKGEEK